MPHKPLEQDSFRGWYSRGISDTVPDSFFTDCLNVKYKEGEVSTRDGLDTIDLSKSNIVRYALYKRLNETPRYIYLDNTGKLYDSLFPGTPIYNDSDFTDFSLVNINNRAYITPHNRIHGLSGKSVIVYEGDGTARLAAGIPPVGTLTAAVSATSGNVEEGYHIFAVCYITTSGFITAPAGFVILSCPGDKKVDVGNIVVGPTGTAGRILLSTEAIPVDLYNGNQLGYEYFFVPDSQINDNVTTTLTVNFYDSELESSADYLFDNLSTIPAGVAIGYYSGRMAVAAENAFQHTIRLSNTGEPESFSSVSGFITVDPSAAVSGVRNFAEFRSNLVIFKSNRIYSTNDNGSDPNTWGVTEVDKSSGAECFGVNTVLDARGTNNDRLFFADRSGIASYEGLVRRPELTYNIEDVWKRINKAKFDLVHLVDDPINHRLIAAVPLDSAIAISHVLVGDYSKAFTVYGTLDEKMIKWAPWAFPSVPVCIVGDFHATTFTPILHVSNSNGIYNLVEGVTTDYTNAIDSYVTTSLKAALSNWLNHFAGIKLRVSGSGTLTVTLYGEDNSNNTSGPSVTLAATPGLEPDVLINFINEKMKVRFRVTSAGNYFTLSKVTIYSKPLWMRRPTS